MEELKRSRVLRQENLKLLMWYVQALTRSREDG